MTDPNPHSTTTTAATAASHPDLPQLSRIAVLGVWAAATLPMGLSAWLLAPWLGEQAWWSGGLSSALIASLTLGLVWQGVLVMLLVLREQGTLRWSVVRDALWLHGPTSRRSGRRGGRVWWVVVPLVVALVATQAVPSIPHAVERDLPPWLESAAGQEFFAGNWTWLAIVVVLLVFNTVLGEELLFRGYLLPRMSGAFGRGDWVANGLLFTLYHLHTPWTMPSVLLTTFVFSWSAKHFRSALLTIAVHSVEAIAILVLLVPLVVD